MSNFEIDSYKFEPQGDSPVDDDWRSSPANLDEDENCLDVDCLAEREADGAERLAFVGKLTEIMIAGAEEVSLPTRKEPSDE